jgi:hypothetical protein
MTPEPSPRKASPTLWERIAAGDFRWPGPPDHRAVKPVPRPDPNRLSVWQYCVARIARQHLDRIEAGAPVCEAAVIAITATLRFIKQAPPSPEMESYAQRLRGALEWPYQERIQWEEKDAKGVSA